RAAVAARLPALEPRPVPWARRQGPRAAGRPSRAWGGDAGHDHPPPGRARLQPPGAAGKAVDGRRRLARALARAAAAAALALLTAASRAHAEAPSLPLSLGSCALLGARPGEVRTLYWELYRHTEVCVIVAPEPGPAGPSPLTMTFSFTHTGRDEGTASPS